MKKEVDENGMVSFHQESSGWNDGVTMGYPVRRQRWQAGKSYTNGF
jgi:dihydroxyacid dehydratase/phosphogluconate dehydratase